MKITLEKEDLAVMLGKAMGYVIHVDDMEVCADPFEVVIRNVRKAELADANSGVPVDETPAQQPEDETPPEPFSTAAPLMPTKEAEKAIQGLKDLNARVVETGGGAGPVPPGEQPMFRDPDVLNPNESYDPDFSDK